MTLLRFSVVALLCSLVFSLPAEGRARASASGKSHAKAAPSASSSKKSSGKAAAKGSKRGARAADASSDDSSSSTSSRRGKRGKQHGLQLPNPGPKRPRGQQAMSDERVREIQAALIREHLLEGEPTGQFDSATRQALADLQAANGWQTKYLPDARALIKLGLGPSHDGLLNPESAAIAPRPTPVAPRVIAPATPTDAQPSATTEARPATPPSR